MRQAPDPFFAPAVIAARENNARFDRMALGNRCVALIPLDEQGNRIQVRAGDGSAAGYRVASGFLVRHDGALYLYTCWHVVTGLDFRNPALPPLGQQRIASLEMSLQDATPEGAATMEGIGGDRRVRVPLYRTSSPVPSEPLWEQFNQSRAIPALGLAGLAAPKFYDVVRIPLNEDGFLVSDVLQVFFDRELWREMLAPGDPLYVAGYPYGFSGSERHKQGFVLRRTPASISVVGDSDGPYLDSPCAPGMSGGPVVVEMGGHLFLTGVYTGARYPDGPTENPRETTALGTFCPLSDLLAGPQVSFAPAAGLASR